MNKDVLLEKSRWIRQQALDFGFSAAGFAKAEFMDEEAERLKSWLEKGYHGQMGYMANHFDKRIDPTKLVEGAKSVISFMYNYYQPKQQRADAPGISIYAYGRDYHKVIKSRLKKFSRAIEERYGSFKGRYFVDSAPILERDWAKRSGLGWIGKNTMLISPKKGSYFFLAEMIVDFELLYDAPISDFCGSCTRCIDACPTGSILGDGYEMDGSKCISYLTIELDSKKDIPNEFKGKMEDQVFGCDICQEVCPWNRFSAMHDEEDFFPRELVLSKSLEEWKNLTEEEFDVLFSGSAVRRTGYRGFMRNLRFLEQEE